MLNLGWGRKVPVMMQAEASECGLVSMAMISAFHGRHLDLADMRSRGLVSARGATLNDLAALAAEEGFQTRGLRLEMDHLTELQAPAILHWDLNHFVVLVKAGPRHVQVHDPALGHRKLSYEEVSRHFTGVALEMRPAPGFQLQAPPPRLKIWDLWRGAGALNKNLLAIFALSMLLQLTLIAAPLHLQWAIDQGVAHADGELIGLLAFGFLCVLAIQMAAQLLRGWLIVRLTHLVAFEFACNLLAHLLRLPLDWFEKRHLGDLTSRFGSLGPVQNALTQGLVTVCVDGFMAMAMLVMMLGYDAGLAALVLSACALYLLARLVQIPALMRTSMDEIHAGAKAESSFLESMRSMPAVRAYGQEPGRLERWQNHQAEALNAGIRRAKLLLIGDGARTLIFGVETIAVIYLGANHVLDGTLSVGMLYAFLSYKNNFTGRFGDLIHQGLELRLLRVHLERLSDPYSAVPELAMKPPPAQPVSGSLELEGAAFRYGEREPWVLKEVNLRLGEGAFTAIIGPSGGGKTTLLKLLLGQTSPTLGELRLAGRLVDDDWRQRYRRSIGVVLQDDVLFAGSLAANLSLFDPDLDRQRLQQACQLAAVDELIASLPMGFETLVGDMGSALSGGQVQRLLLARALYRKPRFLFLDEGTAHLDPANKARIQEVIGHLQCTRVVATHDLEFAAMADQVYWVENGAVRAMEPHELTRRAA